MKKIAFTVVLWVCLFSTGSIAQNTPPAWTAIYQGLGDNSDRFNKIIPDGAGNFIGVGYTVKSGNYKDILTVKFNAFGDTLWWRTKNGNASGDDAAESVGVDAAGNVYVAGTVDNDIRKNDIILIKYDSNGSSVWDTTWDSPASLDDFAVELKMAGNGDIFVGGVARPDTFSGSYDYVTLKYNSVGSLLWASQFSRAGVLHGKDELKGLALDANGDAYVTGRSSNGSDDDFITLKYDGITGSQLWLQPYNSGNTDRAVDIVVDNAGFVIVTGQSQNGNFNDIRTNKYDNAGLLQWTKLYGSPAGGDDDPITLAVDASNNVIIIAEGDVDPSSSGVNFDFETVKYNSSGTLQWSVRTGNTVNQNDVPADLAIDASGNIFVTGKTDNSPSTTFVDNDYMTVKYNASGNLQWGPVYHNGTRGTDDDTPSSIILDGTNVYVGGGAVNLITQKDATVVKYNEPDGTDIWIKDFNGAGDFSENAKAIVIDANNNSYTAGYSFTENKKLNAVISKIDPAGNIICNYSYNGIKNDDDEFSCMAISSNGMVYAAGYTKVTGEKSNFLLVKWSPSTCDTVWTRTYDYIKKSDKIFSIVLDAPGNIYIAGRSDANPIDTSNNYDVITSKYDSNGNLLWMQRYNGSGNLRDEPTRIILDRNGDVLVAGRAENVHDDEFFIIKYNPSTGAPVWSGPAIYNSPFSNDDRINDIAVDASNNIFVAGFSQTSSGLNATQDPVILKFDAAGNMQGFYSYTGDDQDEPVKIAIDINNRVYALFKFDADGGIPLAHNNNFYLQRFQNDLTIDNTFSVQYDSPLHQDDVPADLTISSSGDIYITGSSVNDTLGGKKNKNWVTIGYDESSSQIFISNYDGPNTTDDSPNVITIHDTKLWVAGYTEGVGKNQKDITVNNYSLLGVGVNDLTALSSALISPNPFNSQCLLSFNRSSLNEAVYFEMFDVLGNVVFSPQLVTGNTFILRKGNLAEGVYSYRLRTNASIIANGKLVIN